jgi:hypothetical protein
VIGARALVCAVLVGLGLSFAVAAVAVVGDVPLYYRFDDGLACAGCHGNAGEGGGEGGISIPRLAGRVGPGRAYRSPAALCNLLANGRLADGRRLSNLMPRYMLKPEQCGGLYRFAASLSEPIFARNDVEFAISLVADTRSRGQVDWQQQITDRLLRANEAGGMYGRNFRVMADAPSPLLTIDLTRSSVIAKRTTPTILLQADGKSPLMKAIESSVFDETRAIVAAYSGERILIIDPLAKGPAVLKGAGEPGTELLGPNDCGDAAIDHVIIMSLSTDADFGLGSLKTCKGSKTAAISLRNIRAETIATVAKHGVLPSAIYVFTPVPTGEQFAKIPETIAAIIIDMARRMGANPDRATQIQAFDQAWRAEGRGDAALFAGASLVQVDPLTMLAISAPVWRDAP